MDNKETQGTSKTPDTQSEALRALEFLPEQDQVKVLQYIQQLINYKKEINGTRTKVLA